MFSIGPSVYLSVHHTVYICIYQMILCLVCKLIIMLQVKFVNFAGVITFQTSLYHKKLRIILELVSNNIHLPYYISQFGRSFAIPGSLLSILKLSKNDYSMINSVQNHTKQNYLFKDILVWNIWKYKHTPFLSQSSNSNVTLYITFVELS